MKQLAMTVVLAVGTLSLVTPAMAATPPSDPAVACQALVGFSGAGARVEAARLMAASVDFPQYCLVQGAIAPVAGGFPIHFQVNLPSEWNRRAVHFGGGGFNGSVVSGLNAFGEAHPQEKRPLAAGFVTFGSDSGHSNRPDGAPIYTQINPDGVGQSGQLLQGQRFMVNASFARNDEALANYGGNQLKKTHDAAVAIIRQRYGRAPEKMYFTGHSQGGHEAVLVAQRFGRDYDGIFAGAPVLDLTTVQVVYLLNFQQLFRSRETWLSPKKVETLARGELEQCDALDGLSDGVISAWGQCRFEPAKLRCADGRDTGDACLSDAQIETARALRAETRFPYALHSGVTSHPGWPLGNLLDPVEGLTPVIAGDSPDEPKGHNADLGLVWLRQAITHDAQADWRTFNPAAHADRLSMMSKTVDSLDPDLSAFCGHGGKLMIWVGMSDYRISPYVGVNYYKAVRARLGAAAADRCIAIYASPGLSHTLSSYNEQPNKFAFFQPLQDWVEKGRAPGDLVGERIEDGVVVKSRPLCRNLRWPRYNGTGDPDAASSFSCVP